MNIGSLKNYAVAGAIGLASICGFSSCNSNKVNEEPPTELKRDIQEALDYYEKAQLRFERDSIEFKYKENKTEEDSLNYEQSKINRDGAEIALRLAECEDELAKISEKPSESSSNNVLPFVLVGGALLGACAADVVCSDSKKNAKIYDEFVEKHCKGLRYIPKRQVLYQIALGKEPEEILKSVREYNDKILNHIKNPDYAAMAYCHMTEDMCLPEINKKA